MAIVQVKSFFAALTEDDGWTPQRNRKGEAWMLPLKRDLQDLSVYPTPSLPYNYPR